MSRTILEIESLPLNREAYAVFASCMYEPSWEKYRAKVLSYASDPAIRCFGAFGTDGLLGLLAARMNLSGEVEILGIAVRERSRGRGLGRALAAHALEALQPTALTAETDAAAVGFYRRCGFACQPFARKVPGGVCERFRCRLVP